MNEDRSSRYHRLQRQAALASLTLTGALLGGLVLSGASVALRDAAVSVTGGSASSPLTLALYVLTVAILHEAISLPVVFYRSFLLERRYGLSREPARTWFQDHAKAAGLGLIVILTAAQVVTTTLLLWPGRWWLASALVLMGGILLLTRVTPTALLPMFYRFTPLARESLNRRLLELSKRAGVPVLGIYEWGLGEKTRRANAALVGSGATRRILLSDTLLSEYSDDEIEVIMAHELGHHVHRDIPKALLLEFLLLLAGFWLASVALDRGAAAFGLQRGADVAGLPLVLLAAGGAILAATPLANALSRLNERRADRFALALTTQRAAFISAMKRMGTQNLVEERPSRIALWLFHTHPPIEDRIREARNVSSQRTIRMPFI